MDALDAFIGKKPSGYLYHYTGAVGLIGIVQNRNIWASDYRHLNDHMEYRLGARMLREEILASHLGAEQRRFLERLVASTQKACYVVSFSESRDQLSQWRAYCPGNNGYALGFAQTNTLFASAKQHSFNLIRCVYDTHEQQKLCRYLVESFIEGVATKKSWRPGKDTPSNIKAFFERYQWKLALDLVMSAVKHRGFEEEKEWRLVSQYPDEAGYGVAFRAGRFGVTPYFELPLDSVEKGSRGFDEITIGPTSNRTGTRAALDLLLLMSETQVGRIRLSHTPYRL